MDTYEKKYKDALERMKSWVRGEHPECFSEAQKAAEFIFPELRELELTPFEQHLLVYFQKVYYAHCESQDVNDFLIRTIKQSSKSLLEFAKKEICNGCTVRSDQYWRGRADAIKEYELPITHHYPTYPPPCHYGGICTNPMRDCINCPMHSSGATTNTTTSGTCKKD